ncbi:MAG TPA: Zn-dependent hydrolase, partial [Rubricoccaceae bacterium]
MKTVARPGFALLAAALALASAPARAQTAPPADSLDAALRGRLAQYTTVHLTADLSGLSDSARAMIPHLVDAARAMDEIFWTEASGGWGGRLATLSPAARRYVEVNYGPWDRLDGNAPFLPGVGAKPLGSGFYPSDLTRE